MTTTITTSTALPVEISTNQITNEQKTTISNFITDINTNQIITTTKDQTSNLPTELPTTGVTFQSNTILTSLTTPSTTISVSTTLRPSSSLSIDFCVGVAKTIDCSATGNFVYLTDAFYGVSEISPPACAYR
jgi:hypothetical protein